MISETGSSVGPSKHGDRDLRKAWVAVALLPVAFVLAMLVGEGLISALGYDSGEGSVPVGPTLLAGAPALLILIAPQAAAVYHGHRAHRAGRRAAIVPAWIGVAAVVLAVAVNLLAFLVGR